MRFWIAFLLALAPGVALAQTTQPAAAPAVAADAAAAERLTRKGLALGDHSAQEFNYYVQALQADPTHAPARIHLGGWYRAHNRHDEALRQYLGALASAPDLAIAHFALAEFLWRGNADPAPAEGTEPRYEVKASVRRLELARYHMQRYVDLIGEDRSRAFFTEARIMLAAIEGDLAREKNAQPLASIHWEDAAARLSRPADPSRSPYEGPRIPLFVEFARGSASITHGSTYLLDAVARALSAEQLINARILIEGHADSEGDSKANLDLSKKRAQAVRDYFISRGLRPERFLLAAYGEQRPLVPNDTPALRQQNRRIEVVNWDAVQQSRQSGGQVVSAQPSATPAPAPAPMPTPMAMPAWSDASNPPEPSEDAPAPSLTAPRSTGWEIYQYPPRQ